MKVFYIHFECSILKTHANRNNGMERNEKAIFAEKIETRTHQKQEERKILSILKAPEKKASRKK
jgi:hypothetical protein